MVPHPQAMDPYPLIWRKRPPRSSTPSMIRLRFHSGPLSIVLSRTMRAHRSNMTGGQIWPLRNMLRTASSRLIRPNCQSVNPPHYLTRLWCLLVICRTCL
uniref:Uncharacterized protein n=1 Tax=Cacopsylla melanoneura TaxID=428564 RepID=A0A8D8PWH9_9HEMI